MVDAARERRCLGLRAVGVCLGPWSVIGGRYVACMRALIAIELEVVDGQRPGTRFARLEWVARSLARFAGNQRRVAHVHAVTVHPEGAGAALPTNPLLDLSSR